MTDTKTFALAGTKRTYAPDRLLEPVHVELRLRFELDEERVSGSATTRIRSRIAGRHGLVLDGVDLNVASVEDPSGASIDWRHDGSRIRVRWKEEFAPGEERSIVVNYSVAPPRAGLYFSHPEPETPDRPRLAYSDHETERARYWIPCVDHPSARPSWDLHLRTDEHLVVQAGGVLVGEERHDDGSKTVHWKLEHPCPSYLLCVAMGEFSVHDDGEYGGRSLRYYADKRQPPERLQRSFGRTAEMMEWLEGKLGTPLPFPKYHQFALPEIGGAMENISLVSWDEKFVLDERLDTELGWIVDAVNLHEMAHSWFGDSLVIAHFDDTWLKESWAVYMETAWWEDTKGPEARDLDLFANAEAYFKEARAKYVRPMVERRYDSSWSMFDMHTYPGGAWRIHMLRCLLGDEVFWTAVRDYVARRTKKLVQHDDFRRVLEEHSGRNLVRFFDDWIHAPGHPILGVTLEIEIEDTRAELSVVQDQVDPKAGVGLFRFRLPVHVEDSEGWRVLHLEVSGKRQTLAFEVRGTLRQIHLDPDQTVLFVANLPEARDLLKNGLREGPTLAAKVRCARALIRQGTAASLDAVGQAMSEEESWRVRRSVAIQMEMHPCAASVPSLVGWLAAECHPRVLVELVKACIQVRDARLREALLALLDRDDIGYMARGFGYHALGKQGNPADYDRLVAGLSDPDLHGIVHQGVFKGLGALGSERALERLLAHAVPGGEPDDARFAAAGAIGECARLLGKPERERAGRVLLTLATDRRLRVRMGAGDSIAELRPEGGLAALADLAALQPHQDAPEIERMRIAFRGGSHPDTGDLEKRIDELEVLCKSLESKLAVQGSGRADSSEDGAA